MGALNQGIYEFDGTELAAQLGGGDLLNLLGDSVRDELRAGTVWTPVAFTAPFADFSVDLACKVRRIGLVVYARGLIARTGGWAVSTTYAGALTIPAGFRPAQDHYPLGAASAGQTPATLKIATTGVVDIRTGPTGAPSFVSFCTSWLGD